MPKVTHQETLLCCNYKRCPELKIFEDGSIELSDNDVEAGSVGTIKIRPEAATRLLEVLSVRRK